VVEDNERPVPLECYGVTIPNQGEVWGLKRGNVDGIWRISPQSLPKV
jgi:hypothetical protein